MKNIKDNIYLNYRERHRARVQTINNEPSMTDESQAPECDVNNIIAKFKKTGQMTHVRGTPGTYADVSEIPDLHTAMDTVTKAQTAFDDLPAHLRKRFGNSPIEMVNFLQDPRNDEEAVKLGLKIAPQTGRTDSTLSAEKPAEPKKDLETPKSKAKAE